MFIVEVVIISGVIIVVCPYISPIVICAGTAVIEFITGYFVVKSDLSCQNADRSREKWNKRSENILDYSEHIVCDLKHDAQVTAFSLSMQILRLNSTIDTLENNVALFNATCQLLPQIILQMRDIVDTTNPADFDLAKDQLIYELLVENQNLSSFIISLSQAELAEDHSTEIGSARTLRLLA